MVNYSGRTTAYEHKHKDCKNIKLIKYNTKL